MKSSHRLRIFAVLAGFVAGGLVIAWQGSHISVDGGQPPPPERLRFANIEVDVPPAEFGMRYHKLYPSQLTGQRYVVQFYDSTDESDRHPDQLNIDAETGQIVDDTLSAEHPNAAQMIQTSITIVAGQPQVWPYTDEYPPDLEIRVWGSVAFPIPPTLSGVDVAITSSVCRDAPCVGEAVSVTNGRSFMYISAADGSVGGLEQVLQQDESAFMRYAASVVRSGATPVPTATVTTATAPTATHDVTLTPAAPTAAAANETATPEAQATESQPTELAR